MASVTVSREVADALQDVRVGKLAVVGSHAYGTARPDSDLDLRGFYVADPRDFWNLQAPQESIHRADPDLTVFELRRFAQLAASANPNVLEVLVAPPVIDRWEGRLLTERRRLFFSRRILQTYGGYAVSQLRKAEAGTGGSRGRAHFRREKFVLHLFRLMEQGTRLLAEGDLEIRVKDPERLWEQAAWPLDRVQAEFRRLDAEMRRAADASPLPPEPDRTGIDTLLREVYTRTLATVALRDDPPPR